MKKLAIVVLALGLASCSSLKYDDVKTMNDQQLCSASGNASFNGQKHRFDEIVGELSSREARGELTLTAKECKKFSDLRWNSQKDIENLKAGKY